MSASKYVVIGAGLAGAATAWQLARRGHEVTLVERARPAAEDGSSHGSARIFRYAYPDPFYTDLVIKSRHHWDELERLHGRQLITPSGALDFGAQRTPRLLAEVLERSGVEHELLTAEAAAERWPQITFDSEALWHPAAGVIDAEQSVHAMIGQAGRHGARILSDWTVAAVGPAGGGYRVTAADGRTLDADKIVVAAGGWLPALLADLPLPGAFRARIPRLEVRQEQAYHFPYRDAPPADGGPGDGTDEGDGPGESPSDGLGAGNGPVSRTSWPTLHPQDRADPDVRPPRRPRRRLPRSEAGGVQRRQDPSLRGRPGRRRGGGQPRPGGVLRRAPPPRTGPRPVRRDDLPVHQHPDRGLPRRQRRRHHPGVPLLGARRQVRPAHRRNRRRRGDRLRTAPDTLHGPGLTARVPCHRGWKPHGKPMLMLMPIATGLDAASA